MKKRLIASFLTLAMAFGSVANISAATIQVDGMKQIASTNIINVEGYNLLELRTVFEMLGARVDWNSDKRQATAVKDNITVVISLTDNSAKVNDKYMDLPVNCQLVEGKIYVPVRFVAEALDCKIDWDSQSHTINIATVEDGEYILLSTESGVDEATTVYTYEQALELAIKDSSQLKSVEDSVPYLEELRDQMTDNLAAIDAYDYFLNTSILDPETPASSLSGLKNSLHSNLESLVTVVRSIQNLDMQKGMIDTNKEMIKDGIEISLISQLNAIKKLESQISLLEESVELGKLNITALTLKNELGYTSNYELEKAVTNQKTSETTLETLKISLKDSKENLNVFLGLPANSNISVIYNEEMKSIDDIKLETFIMKQRESAPTIRILKNNLEYAKYVNETNPVLSNELAVSTQNDVKSADRALKDGQDSLESAIRTAYNNIEQLKKQDKSLKLAVEQAIADYNSVVTSYQAGMTTETQVKQAKLGIISAEKAVADNMMQYNTLVYMLEKPYLLSTGN